MSERYIASQEPLNRWPQWMVCDTTRENHEGWPEVVALFDKREDAAAYAAFLNAAAALGVQAERVVDEFRRGSGRVMRERIRQRDKEGWTLTHDRECHKNGELVRASVCYALMADNPKHAPDRNPLKIDHDHCNDADLIVRRMWPSDWFIKPCDRIRCLEKAGALIAAEIDRLARLSPAPAEGEGDGQARAASPSEEVQDA